MEVTELGTVFRAAGHISCALMVMRSLLRFVTSYSIYQYALRFLFEDTYYDTLSEIQPPFGSHYVS